MESGRCLAGSVITYRDDEPLSQTETVPYGLALPFWYVLPVMQSMDFYCPTGSAALLFLGMLFTWLRDPAQAINPISY